MSIESNVSCEYELMDAAELVADITNATGIPEANTICSADNVTTLNRGKFLHLHLSVWGSNRNDITGNVNDIEKFCPGVIFDLPEAEARHCLPLSDQR